MHLIMVDAPLTKWPRLEFFEQGLTVEVAFDKFYE